MQVVGVGQPSTAGSLSWVRLTVFWELMRAQFGETYAESVAKDQVLADLGDRTVSQALADGTYTISADKIASGLMQSDHALAQIGI